MLYQYQDTQSCREIVFPCHGDFLDYGFRFLTKRKPEPEIITMREVYQDARSDFCLVHAKGELLSQEMITMICLVKTHRAFVITSFSDTVISVIFSITALASTLNESLSAGNNNDE